MTDWPMCELLASGIGETCSSAELIPVCETCLLEQEAREFRPSQEMSARATRRVIAMLKRKVGL